MAKLPTLVSAIAEVDGRDRQSVEHIARTIRERGYIPTGKRGGGAADMGPREAVNLLIALNGADTPKEAPIAIDRFRSLRPYWKGTAADLKDQAAAWDNAPEPLQAAADAHTFGEALDALVEGVPDLTASLDAYGHAYFGDNYGAVANQLESALRLRMFGVEVKFERYAASIELFNMNGSERRIQYELHFIQDLDRMNTGFYGRGWPDRRVSATIGFFTLLTAWRGLYPGAALPGLPASAITGPDDAE